MRDGTNPNERRETRRETSRRSDARLVSSERTPRCAPYVTSNHLRVTS